MILSTKQKEGPHRLLSDWIQLEYLWFSDGLSSAAAEENPWGCTPAISPYTPFEPCSLGKWEWWDPLAEQPWCQAPLGHPGQSVSSVQCQLPVALTLPVPSSFPLSSCVSDASWLALAAEDHSFSRSSGWLSGSTFFCPKDNHPKMIGALQFCQLVWNCP